MSYSKKHSVLTTFIASVWFLNGLFCKVLNLVPRHEQIVARILGDGYARPLTIFIGLSEILMSIWTISKYRSKFNALAQMIIVATMNTLEFFLAPDLLLWGKFNAVFASVLICVIYYNEFVLTKKINQQKAV